MQGKIIKGIAGFYDVAAGNTIYRCRAKGIFRNQKVKPLVGDWVEIEILDEKDREGNLTGILPRTNELIRPAVANVDQAIVVFAAKNPKPNYNLLDRFLMTMEKQGIPVIVCFNKKDLVKEKELAQLESIYEQCGHQVIFISAGVGKSSLMNQLNPDANMEVGAVSRKIQRGRHTTRHSELIMIEEGTFVLDTPGFSSLFIDRFEEDEVKDYFQEFAPYAEQCRFQGCSHTHEPDCGVKKALEEGRISRIRYENYVNIYQELKEKRKW